MQSILTNTCMRKLSIFLFIIFVSNKLSAQTDAPSLLVQNFLDTIQKHAYLGKKIQWDSARIEFVKETQGITDVNLLKPHLERFLKSLKDGHSHLFFEDLTDNNQADKNQYEKLATMTDKEAGLPPKNFQYKLIDNKYAYINIPAVTLESRKYVDTIAVQLTNLDKRNPKGWIIDLTENNGGNIMPMIWNFPSLIDTDKTYSYVDAQGKEIYAPKRYTIDNDDDLKYFKLLQLEPEKVKPIKIKHRNVPIVILTSNLTASSGEFFTAYFKGQKNVTVLGQKTNGLTSGNAPFNISKNCMIMLTTTVLKDRNGKLYEIAEGIEPDLYLPLETAVQNSGKKLTYKEEMDSVKKAKQRYIERAILVIKDKS